MKFHYTPGPWRQTGVNVRAFGEDGALVAVATNYWANSETLECKRLANARLISCAPEMLEALTRLLNEIESICAHESGATRDELLERLHMDWDGKLRAARSIISKAKGQP